MRYLVVVAGAAAVLLLLILAGRDPETSGTAADRSEQLDLGRLVYASECAICHGDSGEGGTGPALADGLVERYPDPEAQKLIISRGRNAMVGYANRLTSEEMEAVILYTRTELGRPAPS